MKKLLLVLALGISIFSNAQNTSKFSTDSIEVLDKSGKIKTFECKCNFVYTNNNFIMTCKDRRVTSFLIPGSSFMDLDLTVFYDTGYTVNMNDSSSTPTIGDSTRLNGIGVIYENYESYRKSQYIQYIDTTGVSMILRDKTYIKFK
jgi:hypothetical protein